MLNLVSTFATCSVKHNGKDNKKADNKKMPSKTFTNSKFSYPLLLFQIFGKEFCRSLKEI